MSGLHLHNQLMGDTPRQHSQMNKAYWGEARNPVVLTFPMLKTSLCQDCQYRDLGKERIGSRIFQVLAFSYQSCSCCSCPTALPLPVSQNWANTEGNIACNGQLVPLENQFMLTLGTANSKVVSGCLSGSQAPLKYAFLRLSLYPLATCQELSVISRKPGCYIYSSDAFSPWKVRKVTFQRTFKTHPEGPLTALP